MYSFLQEFSKTFFGINKLLSSFRYFRNKDHRKVRQFE